jgi:hypothetical protein
MLAEASLVEAWPGTPVPPLNRDDIDNCNTTSPPSVLMHQLVVWYMARLHAGGDEERTTPPPTARGLVVWHSTGAGKTISAASIIDAFWTAPHIKRIVVTSLPDAMRANPPSTYYAYLSKFFPRFQGAGVDRVGALCSRRGVVFMSLAQIAHITGLARSRKDADSDFLSRAVIIMDEAHNLFHPPPGQADELAALRLFLQLPPGSANAHTKVFLLTATPGDVPEHMVLLLNAVRDPATPAIQVPDVSNPGDVTRFQERTRGLVSFFDMSSDDTRFPRVMDIDNHRVEMGLAQFAKYVEMAAKAVQAGRQRDGGNSTALKYANMMYTWPDKMSLRDFSAKLEVLMSQIVQYPEEKHYVYSAFHDRRGYGGQGIVAIAKTLERMGGWQPFTAADAAKLCDPSNIDQDSGRFRTLPDKRPRYLLATTSTLSRSKSSKDAASSKEAAHNLGYLVRVFNCPENRYGEYVQIFLASQGYNEGLDLKSVRHVHIFEAFHDNGKDIQTIGRAVRYCSHSQLDRAYGQWLVQVHRYISDIPRAQLRAYRNYLENRLTESDDTSTRESTQRELQRVRALENAPTLVVDDIVRQNALTASLRLRTLHQLVMNNAVDCPIFRAFHLAQHPELRCVE